jgi:hypothetical protein
MSANLLYDTVRLEKQIVVRSAENDLTTAVTQEVAAMTHIQVPGVATKQTPFLSERENQRAVDVIESAERSAPYCLCGSHTIAVAHDEQIVLECSKQHHSEDKDGLSGLLARVTSFSHTRRILMDAPGTI